MKTARIPRRRFIETAAAACAAPLFIPSTALGIGPRPAPSDRITMATIGCGGRGRGVMGGFMGHGEVQMIAVCDPVPAHCQQAQNSVNKRYDNQDCAVYKDFREVLARGDIDAILIGKYNADSNTSFDCLPSARSHAVSSRSWLRKS